MRTLQLTNEDYYIKLESGYWCAGQITGQFNIIGNFKDYTLVCCPFDHVVYLIDSID